MKYKNNSPNIIIITIDAMRLDAFNTWADRISTPLFMDKFAESSVVFDNHYAVATSTLMNLYSMYTGLHPRQQPIKNLKTATIPVDRVTNLGDILHANGYNMWTNMEEYSGSPKIFPLDQLARNYRQETIFKRFSSPHFPFFFPKCLLTPFTVLQKLRCPLL